MKDKIIMILYNIYNIDPAIGERMLKDIQPAIEEEINNIIDEMIKESKGKAQDANKLKDYDNMIGGIARLTELREKIRSKL